MTIEVGTQITHINCGEVTPGTIIEYAGREYRVLENGGVINDRDWFGGPFLLASWGTSTVRRIGVEPVRSMTPLQFKQRARTITYGASRQGGVGIEPVQRALDRFGAHPQPPLGVGMWMHTADEELKQRLRAKTGVVFEIGNPNWWAGYGVFNSAFTKIDGGLNTWPTTARVAAMDDPDTEDYLTPATGEDAVEVEKLRMQVWAIGLKAKRDQQWCEQFESTMSMLGLSSGNVEEPVEPTVAPTVEPSRQFIMPGIPADRDAQRALPAGAILMHPPSGEFLADSWCLLRRVADGDYLTDRMGMGPNSGRHAYNLRVVWDGTGDFRVPVVNHVMMDAAPLGSQVRLFAGPVYTKNAEGWSSHNSQMRHAPSAFFNDGAVSEWCFTRIGV